MDTFNESITVELAHDGFVAVAVDRKYDDGVGYQSTLFFQPGDVRAIADALERFGQGRLDQAITLADGTLRIFDMPPSPMVNIEVDRRADLAHGGYDTLDLGAESVAGVVASLRALSV